MGSWAEGRVRKHPTGSLGLLRADPISSHFSLKGAYL